MISQLSQIPCLSGGLKFSTDSAKRPVFAHSSSVSRTDRYTDRQTDTQTDRQTHRQTVTQTDREMLNVLAGG